MREGIFIKKGTKIGIAIVALVVIILIIALCFILLNTGSVKVGDYVEFGKYNWEVLEIKNGNALLLSERVVEHRPYHEDYTTVTWESSDIREYLNSEFLNDNFSKDEIKRIKTVKVVNTDNPWDFSAQGGNYKTLGGEDTKDKIFLLSLDEVVQYMGNDKYNMLHQEDLGKSEVRLSDGMSDRRLAYDLYGAIGILSNERSASSWALRSPGKYTNNVAFIGNNGDIRVDGYAVDDDMFGIRPAMWVKNAGSLKKSVIECTDPECIACNTGMFTDNVSPDAPHCFICNNGGECTDKVRHNRLYHQWKYSWQDVQSPEKLESAIQLRDKYDSEKRELIELLDKATELTTSDGRARKVIVVSNEMFVKITSEFDRNNVMSRPYYSYDNDRLDKEMDFLNEQIKLFRETRSIINGVLRDIDSNALTFEQDAAAMFGAIGIEILRDEMKENTNDEDMKNRIDEIFGDNKIDNWIGYEDKTGIMDPYLQEIFLE